MSSSIAGVSKTPSKETAPQNAAANAAAQSAKAAATAKAANAVSKIPQSATQQELTRSLGLPADKISASIISFARFFSLPLKPQVLQHIRQQAFTMTPNAPPNPAQAGKDSAPEADTVLKIREALSLAASAAEGKGVELQSKSLETYAQALDPEWRKRQDSEQGDRRGRREKNDDDDTEPLRKTGAINAASLEKMALEMADKNPLLATLNKLPAKDGKRWIVLPFDFSDEGREFKVSLRILLETGKTINRASCMALDIAISDDIEKRRLFVLEPANRLSVYLRPEITPARQAGLVRELSALLEIAPERIFIKTLTESFPFEAGLGENSLQSIDEAV